jgi:Ricin-type beta-trefoil lectin domain-like
MKYISFILLFLSLHLSVISAQKPPVLTANAPAYNFAMSLAENFNIGRRFEELNKNLPVGSLGNMVLSTDFSTRSSSQKAFFLINSERICRNNANYGSGALVIKPLQGVETNLTETAQMHADWLVAQNKLDHCGNPIFGTACGVTNSSPTQRIQGNVKLINGWERNTENIGLSLSDAPNSQVLTLANEKTIYEMFYRNAPNWVHRDNFLQVVTDNYGEVGSEGFLGVGETQAANYNPINAPNQAYGKVLVYSIYDPKTTATNAFSVQSTGFDSSKCYQIIAKHSGKALTVVKGSQTIGAAIIQATLTNLLSQKWKIIATNNGYYELKVLHSGQSLDVKWGGKRTGTQLNQWTSNAASKSQEWQLVPISNGYFKIINRNSGLILSVPIYSLNNNLQLTQLNENSFSNQLWQVIEVPIN